MAETTFKARRLRCPDRACRHIHAEGQPCHVFVRKTKLNVLGGSDSESDSNSDSESESESEEESSDDDAPESMGASLLKGMKKVGAVAAKGAGKAAAAAAAGAKHTANLAKTVTKNAITGNLGATLRLETPEWARALHYKRCNCLQGVPPNNVAFIPVLPGRLCGTININDEGKKPTGGWKIWKRNVKGGPPIDVLRGALPFVNPRSLAMARTVCTAWDPEIVYQPHYQDMHQFEPVLQIEAHGKAIQSCFGFRGYAYTAGDSRVNVWDMRKFEGTAAATCARDTTELTRILEIDAYLYTASSNGAVRQWSLPFNPEKVEFRGQMWLHNKSINDMCHWRFGSESKLFTACDDRECRVWDLTTNRCVHVIEPVDRMQGTLRSVACSDHMLFIGSSNGKIYVFLTEQKCRRQDRHECTVKGPVPYCPQCELRYGEENPEMPGEFKPIVISAMEVGGFHHRDEVLFVGGEDGNIWIYAIPPEDTPVAMEPLVKLNNVHSARITDIKFSWAHVITGASDGVVKIFSSHAVNWGESGELALEKKLQLEGRVKCISIADEDDIEDHCAYVHIGTNRGRLYTLRLGGYL